MINRIGFILFLAFGVNASAQIMVSEPSKDLGDIYESRGKVTTFFTLTNPYKNDTIHDQRFVLYGKYFKFSTRPASSSKAPMKKSVYHRVRKGETLSTIAAKYHVSVAQIRRLNRLGKSSVIRAGRTLRIR